MHGREKEKQEIFCIQGFEVLGDDSHMLPSSFVLLNNIVMGTARRSSLDAGVLAVLINDVMDLSSQW